MVASPINPSNLLTLTGEYGVLPPLPAIGGSEGVGRVVALGGGGIEGLSVGQLVLLPRGGGTWVTHLLADARALIPRPAGADPMQLAMLTVNPPTAALMLSTSSCDISGHADPTGRCRGRCRRARRQDPGHRGVMRLPQWTAVRRDALVIQAMRPNNRLQRCLLDAQCNFPLLIWSVRQLNYRLGRELIGAVIF